MWIKFQILVILLLILAALLGCSQPNGLTVFSAMSLTDVLTEIGEQFRMAHQVKVYFNFAASSTLQRQLEKGASADVFISASPRQVMALETLGILVTNSRRDILSNQLVLVSHESSALSVKYNNSDKDIVNTLVDKSILRIAIGQPDVVPAGTYGKEALTYLDVWDAIQSKLIFGADVRATLAYVTAGNVDAAIVYQTDATLMRNVKVLYQFPAETHSPIVYPAVVVEQSPRKGRAQQFIDYLKTAHAIQIFEKHGFTCLLSE